ncbi:hypothetical protein ND926_00810 [Vibrio diabolicus]|uniref:hypothetical protein n=1 Tax=Vibrio diabolicus TaxID=50719 RepID=UPI00215EC57E|nr:hypothetical protein [Vibrio diabolicus]MCR9567247.1 hypothetical protein [Vibrio alginolyticus]MCS0336019.1 hypothetical protein [Vibrio diabolicus]
MSYENIFSLSAAVIGSVGGAGAIILGLSSWLGKVWANRLMNKEKFRHQEELLVMTEDIKNKNSVELEKLKAKIEASSHIDKLDKTHIHEQRKKIKEVISKNKVNIIDAAEVLNHRMWNFGDNHSEDWHVRNDKKIDDQYYLYSFAYRLLSFFAWCEIVEKEMIYLDSTIADEKDLDFVKFLKIFPQLMCDASLFDGLEYDYSSDTDHFYKNNFHSAVNKVIHNGKVISFEEFKEKIASENIDVDNVIDFLSGITPNEPRLRWFRLESMHFVLLMFINSFGYDFQYTDARKVSELLNKHKNNPILSNLHTMICNFKLQDNLEVKQISLVLNA